MRCILTTMAIVGSLFVVALAVHGEEGPASADATPPELSQPPLVPPRVSPGARPFEESAANTGRLSFPAAVVNPLRIPAESRLAPPEEPMPAVVAPRIPTSPNGVSSSTLPSAEGGILKDSYSPPAVRPPRSLPPTVDTTLPGTASLFVWVVLGIGVALGLAQRHRLLGNRRAMRRPWTPESRESILNIVDRGRHAPPHGDWSEIDSPW